MAYEMVMPYHLHMPSYFLETFTEYPYMVQLNRELNQEWIFRISFPKYSWRISLSLQLPLESSKHLCPHALTANITS